MIRFSFLIVLLSSCSDYSGDYSWIENEWISDREETIQKNRNSGVSEEKLSAFAPLYGYMHWTISNSKLLVTDEFSTTEFDFYIKPVNQTKFLMISDHFENVIIQTNTGFCVHFGENGANEKGKDRMNIECYKKVVGT